MVRMALLQLTGTAEFLAIYFFQALILLQRLYKQAMFDIADMLLFALIAMVHCLVMVVP